MPQHWHQAALALLDDKINPILRNLQPGQTAILEGQSPKSRRIVITRLPEEAAPWQASILLNRQTSLLSGPGVLLMSHSGATYSPDALALRLR